MVSTRRRIIGAALVTVAAVLPSFSVAAAPGDDSVDLGTPEPDATPAGDTGGTFEQSGAGRTTATSTKPRTTTISSKTSGLFGLDTPVRLLDTRGGAPLAANTELPVQVSGLAGVPAGATAVAVNLTVTEPSGEGFIAAYPCGSPLGTSTLNFTAGQTIANMSVVQLGSGKICLTSSKQADVIVDVAGYVGLTGKLFTPVAPTRVYDSRPIGAAVAPMAPLRIQIAGAAGVPATGATAATVNLTIAGPSTAGYATVYPCGSNIPNVSTVNFAKKQGAAANGAVVALDSSGAVCVVSSVAADVIVDVTGWFGGSGTEVLPASPTRLSDTRQTDTGRQAAGSVLRVMAAPGALATVVNIVATGASNAGYLTVWDCDSARPGTSSLNYGGGQTIANAVVTGVSSTGLICISPSTSAHLIVDRTAVLGLSGSGNLATTGSAATDWALTQVGSIYAAMNPYRFGNSKYGKAWDCADGELTCSKVDTQGKTRTTAAGTYAYDCSGLVVAAWLQAGIDLVKQGASWTEPMLTKLPDVTRASAQPGDLLMFDFDPNDTDRVGHVGMYLSDTEMVHAGSCKGGVSAVCRTTINWTNVVAVKRPAA
jgi:uncharacterized protein YycO